MLFGLFNEYKYTDINKRCNCILLLSAGLLLYNIIGKQNLGPIFAFDVHIVSTERYSHIAVRLVYEIKYGHTVRCRLCMYWTRLVSFYLANGRNGDGITDYKCCWVVLGHRLLLLSQ